MEPNNQRHISALPPEVLEQVFQHMDVPDRGRAALACRLWQDVIHQPLMYRDYVLTLDLSDIRLRRMLARLGERGIRHVRLLDQPLDGLPDALQHFSDLRTLDFSGNTHLTDFHLLSVINSLTHLTDLDLSFGVMITDFSIDVITRLIKGLLELKLGYCIRLTDAAMFFIAEGLSRLRSLNLADCLITDIGILHLAGSGAPDHPAPIAGMQRLSISNCIGLTDQSLFLISSGLRNLSWLDASGCLGFTPAGFSHLSGLRSLRNLDLHHTPSLNNACLVHLAAPSMGIVSLNLACCHQLTEAGVVHLVSRLVSSLRNLNLRCFSVGKALVTALLVGRSKIHTLTIHDSNSLTDVSMEHLATLTTLRVLDLADCLVTDEGLMHLADGRSRIETLRLRETVLSDEVIVAEFGRITDEGLLHLARLTCLTTLRLSGCHKVTGAGFRYLVYGAAPVTTLQLFHLVSITDKSLQHLARMSKLVGVDCLRQLTFNFCPITKDGLNYLAAEVAPLTDLTVTKCNQLGLNALIVICAGHNQLRQLDPHGRDVSAEGLLQLRHLCLDEDNVDFDGLLCAARNLPHLRSLLVSGRSRIQAVLDLRTRAPWNDADF